MIELQGLTRKYGEVEAVRQLTATVPRGEIVAFLGPNGAGKTTTIKMLMGFLAPTAGRATIDGLDCFADRVEVKRRVGYLADEPVFFDHTSGTDMLRFVGEVQGLDRATSTKRAGELLEQLDLKDAAGQEANTYSMGMRKRLGLAAAMIHEPPLLILDEPLNGLDPKAARDVDRMLLDTARAGRTVFLSTHLLDRVERIAQRVLIVNRGKLIATGAPDEIRARIGSGTLEDAFLEVIDQQGPASRPPEA